MPKPRSYDASISDLRGIYEKIMKPTDDDTPLDEGDKIEATRSEMLAEMRSALREGLVSSDKLADEIIYDIMLTASNPQDRMRAAELVKKSADSKKGDYLGKPPGEEDLERFFRIVAEVGEVREAISERRTLEADAKESLREQLILPL